LAVFVLGLALAVWARLYLGRNWGMPMSQKADPELVTTGPYRRVRHPIYSGIILAMIGTTIAVSLYWLVAVVLIGAYFTYSAITEERFMASGGPVLQLARADRRDYLVLRQPELRSSRLVAQRRALARPFIAVQLHNRRSGHLDQDGDRRG